MVEIFKALSEESRLRILSLLLQGELCVCEIEESLNLTQSNTSRHLSALKKCGILESNKRAQWTYYKISSTFLQENKELWEYLVSRLKDLHTYNEDSKEKSGHKPQELCISKGKPH